MHIPTDKPTPTGAEAAVTVDNDAQAAERRRKTYHVTFVGSAANMLLMVFKFVAGILGHSAAMIADAVHSLTDFITDIVVVVFVRLSSKPRDADHPYGHGKYETLATAIIGLFLLGAGVAILISGCSRVWHVINGGTLEAPGWIALIAALVSIAVKEVLYQYTMRVGRSIKSKVMEANAWHHRSDALSSIATTLGIAGAILLGQNWRVLDPIAAILVSFLIVKVAFSLIIPAFNELMETSLDEATTARIMQIVKQFPQVRDVHNMRSRRIGPTMAIEMHMRLPGSMTVEESHAITREMERRLRAALGNTTIITLHIEPYKPENLQHTPSQS